MADFEIAYKRTAKIEGGYQDEEDDNGNWTGGAKGIGDLVGTNYGITAPELGSYLGRKATIHDMKTLSPATAKLIFKNNYWDPFWGDKINSQEIANDLYDSAVNMGTGTAIILEKRNKGLQESTHMNIELLNSLNNIV
ncbi:MAG: glycosyl hydrolase 108 family protein [Ginsengibacter sp.]